MASVPAVAQQLRPHRQAHKVGLPRRLPGELCRRAYRWHGSAAMPATKRREDVAGLPTGTASRGGAPAAPPKSAAPSPAAAATAAAPASPRAASGGVNPWRTSSPATTAPRRIYQPQVISWPERRTLNARVVVGITPTGAKTPILGVIELPSTRAPRARRAHGHPHRSKARLVALSSRIRRRRHKSKVASRARSPIFRRKPFPWRRW